MWAVASAVLESPRGVTMTIGVVKSMGGVPASAPLAAAITIESDPTIDRPVRNLMRRPLGKSQKRLFPRNDSLVVHRANTAGSKVARIAIATPTALSRDRGESLTPL